jgi:hypothetical protein
MTYFFKEVESDVQYHKIQANVHNPDGNFVRKYDSVCARTIV